MSLPRQEPSQDDHWENNAHLWIDFGSDGSGSLTSDTTIRLVNQGWVSARVDKYDADGPDDTPGTPAHKCPTRLCQGPAVSVADKSIIVNPAFVRFIEEAADALKIPWQHKVPLSGGTDAGAIHLSRGGVQTGIISVPCRYIHSPSSVVDLRDLEHTVALVIEVARKAPEIKASLKG